MVFDAMKYLYKYMRMEYSQHKDACNESVRSLPFISFVLTSRYKKPGQAQKRNKPARWLVGREKVKTTCLTGRREQCLPRRQTGFRPLAHTPPLFCQANAPLATTGGVVGDWLDGGDTIHGTEN
jgi:hypothetical protein